MGLFRKKEDPFFGLLTKQGARAKDASVLLRAMLNAERVTQDNEKQMFHIEESADEVYKDIADRLNKTFITPIDREDIYALANMLEELTDMHENLTELMVSYKIVKVSNGIKHMSALLEECVIEISKAVVWLKSVRSHKEELLEHAVKIVALEDQSDKLYYREIGKLFERSAANSTNVGEMIDFVINRDMLSKLEVMLNHCEKIAELFRGVVMKYA